MGSFGRGDSDERRAQHAVGDEVALLQHGHDRVGFLLCRHHADGLVLVGIEPRARGRVDFDHLVAVEGGAELAQRGVHAFQQLLGGGRLDGNRGFEAVFDGQEAVGKALDGELAGLGATKDLFLKSRDPSLRSG